MFYGSGAVKEAVVPGGKSGKTFEGVEKNN